jgi:hypothetical protein
MGKKSEEKEVNMDTNSDRKSFVKQRSITKQESLGKGNVMAVFSKAMGKFMNKHKQAREQVAAVTEVLVHPDDVPERADSIWVPSHPSTP